MPTWDRYGNLLSLQDEDLSTVQAGASIGKTSPLGYQGYVAPPSTAGVTRFGPAHLDPAILKPGDFNMQNGGWVGTGQNAMFPKGMQAWDAKTGNYGGTGGGVPAPGTPGGLPAPTTNAMAQVPPSPWQTQPKPMTNAMAVPGATANLARSNPSVGGLPSQNTGAFQPPAGFDVRLGSQDPAINRQVYGENYLPGNLPGYEHIKTFEQFNALTPEQQGAYRQALAYQFQAAAPPPATDTLGPDPRAARAAAEAARTQQGQAEVASRGVQPSTPAAPGFTEAPNQGTNAMAARPMQPGGMQGTTNAMAQPPAQAPVRGNYMGYGSNGGGLRVDPNYIPENWDYKESPEYLWRLQQAEKGLNRQLLSMGRSDSTGGINAMANLRSNIAGEEVDKQYGRAINANQANYGRMFDANLTNYGRTRGEDETSYGRAMGENVLDYNRQYQMGERDRLQGNYLGEQEWSRNYDLANLGFRATQSGVESGGNAGRSIALLLNENGATQASLALSQGRVSADQIKRLLDSGFGIQEIEGLFNRGGGTVVPGAPYDSTLASLPTGQVPNAMLSGNTVPAPGQYAMSRGQEYDFFA